MWGAHRAALLSCCYEPVWT